MTVLIQNVPTPETIDSKPSNLKHTQGDDFTSPMIEAAPKTLNPHNTGR
jgi:hypothetical protein